jgi:hypothetical protein
MRAGSAAGPEDVQTLLCCIAIGEAGGRFEKGANLMRRKTRRS